MIILEDNEAELFGKYISDKQIIFNTNICPEGHFNMTKIMMDFEEKDLIVVLDNNLVNYIINTFTNEKISSEKKSEIAKFMFFTKICRMRLTSGIALLETNDDRCKKDLNIFLEACNNVTPYEWKLLSYKQIEKLFTVPTLKISNDWLYSNEDNEHYRMHYIEMVKLTILLLDKSLNAFEKFINYIQWYYRHLKICSATLVYVAMSLTNNITLPKGIGSKKKELIFKGCSNQAWDITYVSLLTMLQSKQDEIFFFATEDYNLKKLIINTYSGDGLGGLIEYLFPHKKQKAIIEKEWEKAKNGERLYAKNKSIKDKDNYLEKLKKEIEMELEKNEDFN